MQTQSFMTYQSSKQEKHVGLALGWNPTTNCLRVLTYQPYLPIALSTHFLQAYFWTFCCQQWEKKEITPTNVASEADSAADAYVDMLRKDGVLPH